MKQNKYIYVGNDQVAGPLRMEKPDSNNYAVWEEAEIAEVTNKYQRDWNKFQDHLRTLQRIDIVGEHAFTDGQILEEGKDVQFNKFKFCAYPIMPIEKAIKIIEEKKDFEPNVHSTIEEAAKKYANNWTVEPLEYNRVRKHFMAGAKWAASQEVKGNASVAENPK